MPRSIAPLRGKFMLKLGIAAALIALGDFLFFQQHLYGGTFGLFGMAMLLGLALARPAIRHDGRAWIALAFAALYALAMARDASLLAWALFWTAACMATLLPGTARFDDGWRWFQRLLAHGFLSVFGPPIDLYKLARARRRRPAPRRGLRAAMPVVALPLLGSGVILFLFAAANPVIEQALASVSLPEPGVETVLRVMLWGVLFLLVWWLMRPRLTRFLIPTFDGHGEVNIPGVSVASIRLSLLAFNLLFVLQNAMDAAWLWGLMPLPEGMTLAEYAHRGAYPLIVTALLAALFVLVTLRPGSSTANDKTIRHLVVLWIGQNVLLVASSILRTLDYVDAYSLTRLRIAALAWMALVAVGLVLICWRMLRGKSAAWLINANLGAAGLLLTAYAFVDTGALAAGWNVRHAREAGGQGAELDLCYLNQLGGSSLLPLIELEQRQLPEDFRRRVRFVRETVYWRLESDVTGGGWTWLGAQRLARANELLGPRRSVSPYPGPLDCAGRPYQTETVAPPPPAAID